MARLCMKDVVVGFLASLGIACAVEAGKKHLKVRFLLNGQKRMYVCSKTPSDYRAAENCRADLRRMVRDALGVEHEKVPLAGDPPRKAAPPGAVARP